VPINEISKVELAKIDMGKTMVFIAGYALGLCLVVGLIILNNNAHSFE
jgi:hypothetical protein